MTIWAFNCTKNAKATELIYQSIKNGKSRFGWSSKDEDNLKLDNSFSKLYFLLQIKKGDWIIHINTPIFGKCTVAKVLSEYDFDKGLEFNWGIDFRHYFEIDADSIIEFDRNDPNVLPLISSRLKLRGKYWRIYYKDEFLLTLQNLKENRVNNCKIIKNLFHLKESINAPFEKITELIHRNYPGKELEKLIAEVFRKVPTVLDVKENGSGWKSDFGADLIVNYDAGLPLIGLRKQENLIVQIKSFEGEHWETKAVKQIRTGIEKFDGDAGLLITTAKSTPVIEEAIEKLSLEIDKPVSIIAGIDVAKFVLEYFSEEIF